MIYKLGSDGNSFWPDHIEEELEILLQKSGFNSYWAGIWTWSR